MRIVDHEGLSCRRHDEFAIHATDGFCLDAEPVGSALLMSPLILGHCSSQGSQPIHCDTVVVQWIVRNDVICRDNEAHQAHCRSHLNPITVQIKKNEGPPLQYCLCTQVP